MPTVFRQDMTWHHDGQGGCRRVNAGAVPQRNKRRLEWDEALRHVRQAAGQQCSVCRWPSRRSF